MTAAGVAGLLLGRALEPALEVVVPRDPVTQIGPVADERVVDEFGRRFTGRRAEGVVPVVTMR